jgi:hypothetical protein
MKQNELFAKPSLKKIEVKQPPKKSFFTPGTLINGLQKGMVMDHAMLWVRSLAKAQKNNPKAFLSHQKNEILFKQSGVDAAAVIRQSIVLDKVHT